MRILVTNHHLDQRAGSELATAEVAGELVRRGHEVAVFTLIPGDVARRLTEVSGIPVLTPGDAEALLRFDPEVIHVHHWPTVTVLEQLGIVAPWVIGFHGGLPALEHPPSLTVGATVPWWGMCRGTMERVSLDPTWAAQPHQLVNNWFDDTAFVRPSVRSPAPSGGLERILVVSNHFPELLWSRLGSACRAHGIAYERVGLPHASRELDPAWLAGHDALVTIGRTAVIGQALGLPVLVADHLGCDGWLTPDTRQMIADRNYSGTATGRSADEEVLATWLDAPPQEPQLRELQDWVYGNATLSGAVDRLEQLYRTAQPVAPTVAFGRWSQVVADYARHLAATQGITSPGW